MEFIQDDVFKKMSKKEKLKLPTFGESIKNPHCIVMIRTTKKRSGYFLSAFFIKTDMGWIRGCDYDVIFSHSNTHIDFEYGGIRLFTPDAKEYNWGSVYF